MRANSLVGASPAKSRQLLPQLSVPKVARLSLSPVLDVCFERAPGRDGVGGQCNWPVEHEVGVMSSITVGRPAVRQSTAATDAQQRVARPARRCRRGRWKHEPKGHAGLGRGQSTSETSHASSNWGSPRRNPISGGAPGGASSLQWPDPVGAPVETEPLWEPPRWEGRRKWPSLMPEESGRLISLRPAGRKVLSSSAAGSQCQPRVEGPSVRGGTPAEHGSRWSPQRSQLSAEPAPVEASHRSCAPVGVPPPPSA